MVGAKRRQCFRIDEENAANKLAEGLYCYIFEAKKAAKNIALICIGSDRATGDSLRPIIGNMLSQRVKSAGVKVYGNLNCPVHAANIRNTINEINENGEDSLIIAVDAALSKCPERVGILNMGIGPLNPGAFAEKELPAVGHIYITGVVNWAGRLNDIETLQSTRLGFVMKMADIMSCGIAEALNKWGSEYRL